MSLNQPQTLIRTNVAEGSFVFQFDDIGVTSAYPNRMLAFTLILDQRGNADQDSQR
jgi:hypothetical protein